MVNKKCNAFIQNEIVQQEKQVTLSVRCKNKALKNYN